MKHPPASPHRYRIHYRDGRIETVEARTCVQVGVNYVFDREDERLRVPTDIVLRVEALKGDPMRSRRRRA